MQLSDVLPNPNRASRALLLTVARLHYESDLSQIEIARQLDLSAATISRLLRRARQEGIVHIEIRDTGADDGLATDLAAALGLKQAALVDSARPGPLATLAGPVGTILRSAGLGEGSVLAIGWGRAVREVIRAGLPRIPGVVTVPATGGMQEPAPHFQINEFVRQAAEQLGGTPQFIHLPYLPSARVREAMLDDPVIAGQVALWDRIDAAILGVGLPHSVDPVHAGAATAGEKTLANVAGDVIRHYFSVEGELVDWEGRQRLIAVSPAQLRAVPLSIGVAVSPEKARAILGAVRAGLINALVTDTATARTLLDLVASRAGAAGS